MSSPLPADPEAVLGPYGWDERVAARVGGFARPGRVVRVEYGAVVVRGLGGELVADWTSSTSRQAGVGGSPAVGDWVDVADESGDPVVVAVAERWSALLRGDPAEDHRPQVLAANVDVVFVVAAADLPLNVRRLDRLLAMAWGSGATPVLVLSKLDLEPDADPGALVDAAGPAEALAVSARTGEGLDRLRQVLGAATAVFVGPSGVGKSSLVNALAGDELMAVGAVRDRDGKGRHTTTTRELFPLPGGGVVIDTPGLRAAQLWDPRGGIDAHFADLAQAAARCRFSDCAHQGEPGCEIGRRVEDGRLDPTRLERWAALHAEADEWEERRIVQQRRRGRSRR